MRLHEIEEAYGVRPGGNSAGTRQSGSDMQNINKRSNNKAMDQGREANIRAKSQTRRANRLGKKIPTGLPQRILNPQQAQAPEQQS
jgi:hypothetical protein|tara:strand:+ start:323 stop:580 length:258 start_codon:yes stop_codon:yes gene_type:complete